MGTNEKTGLFRTGGPQLKKVLLAAVVGFSLFWLSYALKVWGITNNWLKAYFGLLATVGGGYLGGKGIGALHSVLTNLMKGGKSDNS